MAIGYIIGGVFALAAAAICLQPRRIEGRWHLVSMIHGAETGKKGAWFDPETNKPFVASMVAREYDLILKNGTIVKLPPADAGPLADAVYGQLSGQADVINVPPGCAAINRDGDIYLASLRSHGGRVLI